MGGGHTTGLSAYRCQDDPWRIGLPSIFHFMPGSSRASPVAATPAGTARLETTPAVSVHGEWTSSSPSQHSQDRLLSGGKSPFIYRGTPGHVVFQQPVTSGTFVHHVPPLTAHGTAHRDPYDDAPQDRFHLRLTGLGVLASLTHHHREVISDYFGLLPLCFWFSCILA